MIDDLKDVTPAQRSIAERIIIFAQAKDENFSLDPFTIMAICNCIISVIKLLYMCYSKDSIASAIKNHGYVHSILLKREIRKHFKDRKRRKVIYDSFKEVGTSLSKMELINLMESI